MKHYNEPMETRNRIRLGFLLVTVILLIIFKSEGYVNSTSDIPIQPPPPTFDICSNHGGVNCTILNSDASVVCNDGTIDQSFFIYAVTQCQQTIEDIGRQESAFMNTSGCIPPGEMGCINEQSYKNLSGKLADSLVLNSELGRSELAQCRQQIKNYTVKNTDYQQCLAKNNNPQFNLPGNRLFQPILKAVFCPIFYGEHTTYDYDSDLCLCDNEYFLSNDKCTSASSICQTKYGLNAYAENGNCSCNKGYQFNNTRTQCIAKQQARINSPPTPTISPGNPIQTYSKIAVTPLANPPASTVIPKLQSAPIAPPPSQPIKGSSAFNTNINFMIRIFNTFLSGIKNILNLP